MCSAVHRTRHIAQRGTAAGWPPIHTPMADTKGLCISWSRCHKAMILWEVVGPPGLEPGNAG